MGFEFLNSLEGNHSDIAAGSPVGSLNALVNFLSLFEEV
jgi:hypothetical protein